MTVTIDATAAKLYDIQDQFTGADGIGYFNMLPLRKKIDDALRMGYCVPRGEAGSLHWVFLWIQPDKYERLSPKQYSELRALTHAQAEALALPKVSAKVKKIFTLCKLHDSIDSSSADGVVQMWSAGHGDDDQCTLWSLFLQYRHSMTKLAQQPVKPFDFNKNGTFKQKTIVPTFIHNTLQLWTFLYELHQDKRFKAIFNGLFPEYKVDDYKKLCRKQIDVLIKLSP